jgi:hypothetical protein
MNPLRRYLPDGRIGKYSGCKSKVDEVMGLMENTEKNNNADNLNAPAKNGIPLVIKVLSAVVIFILIGEGVAVFWGRDIAIVLIGTKNYYAYIESGPADSAAKSLSKRMTQPNGNNTVELASKVVLNKTKKLPGVLKAKTLSETDEFITKLTAGDLFDLKLGKNPPAKTFAGTLDWKYGSGKPLNAQAYLSSEQLVLASSALPGGKVNIKAGDVPSMGPLFELTGGFFGNESVPSQAQLDLALNSIASEAFKELKNKDVTINRNKISTVSGVRLKCDEITVRLSQDELKSMLKNLSQAAGGNPALKNYNAVFSMISDYVNDNNTGGITMTILVQNVGFLDTEVVSRSITTDSGYGISYSRAGKAGEFLLKMPNASLDFNYTEVVGIGRIAGSGVIRAEGSPDTIFNATFHENEKTALGLYTGVVTGYTTFAGSRVLITADLSKDGADSKLDITAQHSGKDYFESTFALSATGSSLTVPGAD